MIHQVLMALAGLIRFFRKWAVRLSLVIFLVVMNVATLVSNTVYDALSRMVWSAVELVSDQPAERRPKTRAEMEADTARARAASEVAEAAADAARGETARTRALLDEVDAQNRTLATRLETSKSDAELARGQIAKAREELGIARKDAAYARSQLDAVSARNREITAAVEIRDRQLAEVAVDAEAARKSHQQAIDAATRLKARMVNSIRRNASSEAIGAVPFIGTAVFLGSVAYELNDACQQLRELETLDAALLGKESAKVNEEMCLLSYEDMVAALTGKDRAYARCVADRVAANDLNPPSCEGYEPALPGIGEDNILPPQESVLLPRIE
jgi:hypothetical protein